MQLQIIVAAFFYFRCKLKTAAVRRWLDLEKSVPLKEVKKSLKIRTRDS